jgi:hypothetical protein
VSFLESDRYRAIPTKTAKKTSVAMRAFLLSVIFMG